MPSKGRPTICTPELVAAAWEYADGGWQAAGDPVPSIAGLACEIGVHRETLRLWAKDENNDFFGILNRIAELQEKHLIRGGLGGDFNGAITKMMMTKHGYSDRIEQDNTSSDGSMSLAGLFDSIAARKKTINDEPE
jgi:hypothetical protein